jgi:hypothetical protein
MGDSGAGCSDTLLKWLITSTSTGMGLIPGSLIIVIIIAKCKLREVTEF